LTLRAPKTAKVLKVSAAVGDLVPEGFELVDFEPEPDPELPEGDRTMQ
jgi:hypothetical protein